MSVDHGRALARGLSLTNVRGIVFDLDGTLIDSYRPIAASLNRAREAFGLPALDVDEVRRHVGRGLERLVASLVGQTRVEEGVRLFREHYARVFESGTVALQGASEVLEDLHRRGYRMSVASNKPARFGEAILERLGLIGFLDSVEGPDRAGHTKPHPAMIERCLRAMGIGREEAVYVGDMALDVESASRAGLAVLLVPGGSCSSEELEATGRPVLANLHELLSLLPNRVRSPDGGDHR